MSTKIYYAYRLPKGRDVLAILQKIKRKIDKDMSQDKELLREIHLQITTLAYENIANNESNPHYYAKETVSLNELKVGKQPATQRLADLWLLHCLRNTANGEGFSVLDMQFECAIFYDRKYWYIKFFPNYRWHYKVIKSLSRYGFQDFHYQNQTDPPTNIPTKTYEAREAKWEKLVESGGGNYSEGFIFNLYSTSSFMNLIRRSYFTGKPLYKHLAYQFDEKFEINPPRKEEKTPGTGPNPASMVQGGKGTGKVKEGGHATGLETVQKKGS